MSTTTAAATADPLLGEHPPLDQHPVLAGLRTVETALDNWDLVASSWLPAASDDELQRALHEFDQLQVNIEAFLVLMVLESARRRSLREPSAAGLAPEPDVVARRSPQYGYQSVD